MKSKPSSWVRKPREVVIIDKAGRFIPNKMSPDSTHSSRSPNHISLLKPYLRRTLLRQLLLQPRSLPAFPLAIPLPDCQLLLTRIRLGLPNIHFLCDRNSTPCPTIIRNDVSKLGRPRKTQAVALFVITRVALRSSRVDGSARFAVEAAVKVPCCGKDAGDHVDGRFDEGVDHGAARGVPRWV